MKKYFGKFNSETDIQNAINDGELSKPYVALVGGVLDYNSKSVVRDWANEPLTVICNTIGDDESFEGYAFAEFFNTTGGSAPITISYSLNGGEWLTAATSANDSIQIQMNAGDELVMMAEGNVYGENRGLNLMNGTFTVAGNIMSMIYGENFAGQYEFPENTTHNFYQFFAYDAYIVDAQDLYLPATALTESCYEGMFYDCEHMSRGPIVGSLVGFSDTYTLDSNCCKEMFKNCIYLVDLTCLIKYPTDATASDYFDDWMAFEEWMPDETETGTFYKDANMDGISAGPWETDSVDGIPEGWTAVNYSA